MDKKTSFRRSLLSSAIIAATLQTLSASAQAATCPPANASGNIHVGAGEFCEGGITVNAGTGPVNDIGIQGRVNGDVLVDDGISDFWMSAGELNGSFTNNAIMRDINIDNGATVFSDIHNNGDMRFLTVSDDPGVPTVIHGNISNDGNITRVHITGSKTLVKGDVINSAMGTLSDDLLIDSGATIEGNVTNWGSIDDIRVENAHIGGNLLNSGDVFVFTTEGGSTVEGDMVNTGSAVFAHVGSGSHIGGDFINSGIVQAATMVDGASVAGSVTNGVDGYTDGLIVMNGSSVGAVNNKGDAHYLWIESSDVNASVTNDGSIDGIIQVTDGSTIGGNLVNNGTINPSDTDPFFGPFINGESQLAGIEVKNGSAVSGDVVNNGSITLDYTVAALPDGFVPASPMQGASLAGISVNNGAHAGRIVNNGTLTVTNGQAHGSPEFIEGAYVNGIEVTSGATTDGIINDGVIVADTFGILVDGSGNDGVTVNGDVINTSDGSITSKDNGIYILNAEVTGNVQNDGDIRSTNDNTIDIEDSVIGGSVINNGSLTTQRSYDAIDIDDSTVGGVLNTGFITTGEDGFDIDDSKVLGNVDNAGIINAMDEGYDIDQSDFDSDLINSGFIIAGGVGITIEGEENTLPPIADGGAPVTEIDYVSIGGSFINGGEIVAGEHGIQMEYVDIAGDFDSSGSIQAGPQDALPDGNDYFHGIALTEVNVGNNVTLGEISASGFGVTMNNTTVGGDVTGSGNITSVQEDALSIVESSIVGSLINQGALSAHYNGIELSDTSIGSDVTNSGDITATNGSGIVMHNTVTIGGNFTNTGNITADDFGILLEGDRFLDDGNQVVTEEVASITGDFINSGNITTVTNNGIKITGATIGGEFRNTGDITTNNKYAINVESNSHITDGLFNSGTLSGNKGIRVHGTAQLEDGDLVGSSITTIGGVVKNAGTINSSNDAIRVVGSEIGGLVNTGAIFNTGSDAIDIDDAIINGNIENHGLINTTTNDAIDINDAIVHGSIINSGLIDSTGAHGIDINSNTSITGDIINTADGVLMADSEALVINQTDIQGSIINDGLMIARRSDAIRIDDSFIGGDVINNGILRAGDNAFELDGREDNPLVIAGNLENRGHIFALQGEGVTEDGDDAFHIDDLEVRGSVINTGTIVAGDEAYEIDRMTIGGNWENTGAITAGDNAFDVDNLHVEGDWFNSSTILAGDNGYIVEGSAQWQEGEEIPDGETPGYFSLTPTTIGGRFVNEGNIEAGDNGIEFTLVSVGTKGVLDDGQANFENSGTILAKHGSAMDLSALTVTGDFINTGDLDAQKTTGMAPPYSLYDNYTDYRGISLTGHLYKEGPEGELLVRSTIAGTLSNEGAISAIDQGIYIRDTDIVGNVENTGAITSMRATGIDIAETTIGGSFLNAGDIDASMPSQEGDHYRDAWGGTPTEDGDIVLQATGVDDAGNAWFLVRNEGTTGQNVMLQEQSGDFSTQNVSVAPGEEIYINAGHLAGDLDLSLAGADGVLVTTSINDSLFVPESESQHGISFVGVDVEGVVKNEDTGIINAATHGIALFDGSAHALINTGNVSAGEHGLLVDGTHIEGNLYNNGTIDAGEDAIRVVDTMIGEMLDGESVPGTGHVISGSDATIIADDDGIRVKRALLAGGVENHGIIDAGENGIDIDNADLGGGVLNTGTITAGASAIDIGGEDSDGRLMVDGAVINTGAIIAGDFGIDVEGVALNGDVRNATGSASITSALDGIRLDGVTGVGHLVNEGTITAGNTDGSGPWVDGITANDVQMDGLVGNSGAITAAGSGIMLREVDGATGFVNTGSINVRGSGLLAYRSTINGDIGNATGSEIVSGYDGIRLSRVNGADRLINEGTIDAQYGDGISLANTYLSGNLVNASAIESGRNGISLWRSGAENIVNTGSIDTTPILDDGEGPVGDGIRIRDGQLNGVVLNDVNATIKAKGQGIIIERTDGITHVANMGALDAGGEGISIIDSSLSGMVYNSGQLSAGGDGIRLLNGSIDGQVLNAADSSITAGGHGISVDNVSGVTDVLNFGNITADSGDGIRLKNLSADGFVVNLGTINAAQAGINLEGVVPTGDLPDLPPVPPVGAGLVNEGVIDAGGGARNDGLLDLGSTGAGIYVDSSVIIGAFPGGDPLNGIIPCVELVTCIPDTVIEREEGSSDIVDVDSADYELGHHQPGGQPEEADALLARQVGNTGTIDAGTVGIRVVNGGLSGDVYNLGDEAKITAGDTGILLDNVQGVENILNSGTISAGANGIRVNGVEANGDVINDGAIITDGLADGMTAGIGLTDVKGIENVINNGGILAGQTGGEGNIALGIGINDSAMDGNVENNGLILSNGYAIAVDDVEGVDSIINRGGIATNARGIYVVNTELAGDIENQKDGEIISRNSAIYLEGVDAGHLLNAGTIGVSEGHGMKAINVELAEGVLNSGTLAAGHHGISLDTVTADGSVVNTGTIMAGYADPEGNGIEVDNSTLNGEVANGEDGVIKANAHGIVITDTDGVTELLNAGTIEAGVHGMVASQTDLSGELANSGTITTQGIDGAPFTVAMGVMGAYGDVVYADSMINRGTIEAGQAGGEANNALGMAAEHVVFNGAVINEVDAVVQSSGVGVYLNHVDGVTEVINAGALDTDHHGIALINTKVAGELTNSGSIDSRFSGLFVSGGEVGSVSNTNHLSVMEGHGIKLINTTVAGDVANSGVLSVGHHGISLDNVVAAGGVTNTGVVSAGSAIAEGNGIEVDNSTLGAGVLNAAGAEVTASAGGVVVSNATIAGEMRNDGTITTQGVNGITAGLGLQNVTGVTNFVNAGDITVGQAGGEGNIALGMAAFNVAMAGDIANTGNITSSSYGIYLDQVTGANRLVNEGSLNAAQSRGISVNNTVIANEVANVGSINALNSALYLQNAAAGYLSNTGSISVSEGHGIKVLGGGFAGGITNDTDATVSAGHHGISLDSATLVSGHLLNRGTITAGTANAEGNGIEAFNSMINGLVANDSGASIEAAAGGIVLDNTVGVTGVINEGTIKAGGVGIDIRADSDEYSVGDLKNSGTLTAEAGAAIRVAGATVGPVINTGTITGGVAAAAAGIAQASRDLNTANAVAMDFRDAGAGIAILNGEGGVITGDVYGSVNHEGDQLVLASTNPNQFTGDVYDVEDVSVLGTATLNSTVFSFNNSSTVTIENTVDEETGERVTGTLVMGTTDNLDIEGDYDQKGVLTGDVNVNERSYDDAWVETTGQAMFSDASTIFLNLPGQDIRNLDTTDGGSNLVIASAQGQVADNGVALDFGAASKSIILNTEKYISEDGVDLGANVSIAALEGIAAAGGADSNASNALAALQGIDSAGLVELVESNPDLYNAIFNAGKVGGEVDVTAAQSALAAIADQLVASPETGIAAGQSAQAEAVNTILTRIAELRTGASGISAGDDDESSNIRPDSLWIRAIYTDGDQDSTSHNGSNFNAYSLRSTGFTIGADKDVSDTLTLGVGVTLANSTVNEKGSAQRANSETKTVLGSVYAGWRDQDYFADASVSLGKGGTDLKSSEWEADYDSTQIGVSVLAGKSILFNNNDTLVEPRVGFNYTRLESEKYSYEGAGGTEHIGSQNLETLELGAGVRFVTGIEMGDGLLLPEASLMAWHDFKGDNVEANVEFETGGGSFTYFGPEAEKTRYQAGVGAEYLMDNNFSVSVNYEHNWQDGFKADTVVAKLRYDF